MTSAPTMLIRLQNAQERVQECRKKASSTWQRVDEAKASQADSRSQNRVLDSLTQLQNSGRIQSFHVCSIFIVALENMLIML